MTPLRKSLRRFRRKSLRTAERLADRAVRAGWKNPPVLVWQMGKVGSNSIHKSLRAAGVPCIRLHRIVPESIRRHHEWRRPDEPLTRDEKMGLALAEQLKHGSAPIRIITMVREPVNRNVSAYFQNLDKFFVDGEFAKIETEKALETFLGNYAHGVPLQWFDREIRELTGVDVYAHPFDREKEYTVIREGRFSILVFRIEADDEVKAQALADFLGLDRLDMLSANVGSEKSYAELYRAFRQQVTLPADYVEEMLESKYARHFYTEAERDAVREQWLRQ